MNGERLHNALNFLDDDLIGETDELRQGRRVLRRSPGRTVIHWMLPAACLALVIGAAAMPDLLPKTENSAALDAMVSNESGMTSGELVQDSFHSETGKANFGLPADWQRVEAGEISLEIPGNWTYEVEEGDDQLYIVIRPDGVSGQLRVGYDPSFGVCGTGLTEKEAVIAGMKASVGYFDGGTHWSFITFRVGEKIYVVRKDGAESWWNANEKTVDNILETIVITE